MTEISKNTPVAHVVATPSPAGRKAPAPTPAATARPQAPVKVEVEAAEKTEAPAASGNAASTAAASAVKPLNQGGPTRVTAYSDASSGRYVIQVRETESNEVINQYPPKELLRFYAAAREALEQAVERTDKGKDVSA